MENLVKKELGVVDYRDYFFEDDLSILLRHFLENA